MHGSSECPTPLQCPGAGKAKPRPHRAGETYHTSANKEALADLLQKSRCWIRFLTLAGPGCSEGIGVGTCGGPGLELNRGLLVAGWKVPKKNDNSTASSYQWTLAMIMILRHKTDPSGGQEVFEARHTAV